MSDRSGRSPTSAGDVGQCHYRHVRTDEQAEQAERTRCGASIRCRPDRSAFDVAPSRRTARAPPRGQLQLRPFVHGAKGREGLLRRASTPRCSSGPQVGRGPAHARPRPMKAAGAPTVVHLQTATPTTKSGEAPAPATGRARRLSADRAGPHPDEGASGRQVQRQASPCRGISSGCSAPPEPRPPGSTIGLLSGWPAQARTARRLPRTMNSGSVMAPLNISIHRVLNRTIAVTDSDRMTLRLTPQAARPISRRAAPNKACAEPACGSEVVQPQCGQPGQEQGVERWMQLRAA